MHFFLLLGFSIEVQSLSLTSISKVFQNDCTNLYFHQQYVSLLYQLHVVFFFFFHFNHSDDMNWLHCSLNSVIADEVQQFLLC